MVGELKLMGYIYVRGWSVRKMSHAFQVEASHCSFLEKKLVKIAF